MQYINVFVWRVVSIRQSAEKVQKMRALHNALLYTDSARCYHHLEEALYFRLGI